MKAFAMLGTVRCVRAELHVPPVGPWFADLELEDATTLTGAQTLTVGDTTWKGTVAIGGTFRDQRMIRLVGGAGGWGNLLPAKGYHNDAGVKARLILEDAARLAGETLAPDAGVSAGKVGNAFSRQSGPASWVAQYVDPEWWVDADGVTHTGPRPSTTAPKGSYEVQSYNPRLQIVDLACDSIAALIPGAVISEHLDSPLTIREVRVDVSKDGLRVTCWTGGGTGRGRIPRALESIVRQAIGGQLLGIYRYRVVSMASPRVQLQAIRGDIGLPDILPAEQHPGMPGAHGELTPGTEVLVQFVDGDPAQPVITGYAGKGQASSIPTMVSLSGGTQPVSRQGDLVMSGGPTTMIYFGPPGPPFSPVLTGTPYPVFFGELTPNPADFVPLPYLSGFVAYGNPLVLA